jgi:hypothetical protein
VSPFKHIQKLAAFCVALFVMFLTSASTTIGKEAEKESSFLESKDTFWCEITFMMQEGLDFMSQTPENKCFSQVKIAFSRILCI